MIRPYKPEERQKLLDIFRLNTPKYFDKKEIADFEDYLEQKGETYLTIELNNKIVGGTGYSINQNNRTGAITWIFFDPNYAGQGLGKKAVKHCLNILSKDYRVEKFVVRTSQLAFQFFGKFGYTISRIEKNYWGDGLDLYEMEMLKK